jgi:hypothetical protein
MNVEQRIAKPRKVAHAPWQRRPLPRLPLARTDMPLRIPSFPPAHAWGIFVRRTGLFASLMR